MRGWLMIPLMLGLVASAGTLGAQIYYAPVSYDVTGSSPADAEAKYKLEGGLLEVQVSSDGVRADPDTDLPSLRLQLEVKNKTSEVASIDPARQVVTADSWGELSPERALVKDASVQGPVVVRPGKSVDVDLIYGLSRSANPAQADRFTLKWVVALPGGDQGGETLFKQVEMPYRAAYWDPRDPWGPWHRWGWDPFFVRPVGPFFFDPFFHCGPFSCGHRVIVVRDRDRLRELDGDDLHFREGDDRRILDRDDLDSRDDRSGPRPPAGTVEQGTQAGVPPPALEQTRPRPAPPTALERPAPAAPTPSALERASQAPRGAS